MPLPQCFAPDCPFCGIATAYPPSVNVQSEVSSSAIDSPIAYVLLSTPLIVAFLDIAPISRGHVLIATRQHREKLSDVSVDEGRALGAWMGIISRAVVKSVDTGKVVDEVGDWNLVQNNGARAAQVVPHVHFHIIPRSPDVPEVRNRSWTVFGKGQREELDDEDALNLVQMMRDQLAEEILAVEEKEGKEALRMLMGPGAPTHQGTKL